jgi:uroporphyrinogen decarboxylase
VISERENWLRTVEYRYPAWIPVQIGFSPPTWRVHRERLEEIVLRHPALFPGYRAGSTDFDAVPDGAYRQGERCQDNWGCVWENIQHGLEGQCVGHPLAEWAALGDYTPPDPLLQNDWGHEDWEGIAARIADEKGRGLLTSAFGGRLFDRLYFLRGFENLMMDFATGDPHLPMLIEILEEQVTARVRKCLELGVDVVGFHTDIGTQQALMISPAQFRQYLKPMFTRVFRLCRKAGAHVQLSTDGRVLDIVGDFVDCGVSLHDPQLRACTLEGIRDAYKGRLCALVDLDRQMFAFCSPDDILRQVEHVVKVMSAPEGGLMIMGSVYGGNVPLDNLEALCQALEQVRTTPL